MLGTLLNLLILTGSSSILYIKNDKLGSVVPPLITGFFLASIIYTLMPSILVLATDFCIYILICAYLGCEYSQDYVLTVKLQDLYDFFQKCYAERLTQNHNKKTC